MKRQPNIAEQFYIVDKRGELVADSGDDTEREAYDTLRYFREEQGERDYRVVHFRDLSPVAKVKLRLFEDRVRRLTAKMRGRAA